MYISFTSLGHAVICNMIEHERRKDMSSEASLFLISRVEVLYIMPMVARLGWWLVSAVICLIPVIV